VGAPGSLERIGAFVRRHRTRLATPGIAVAITDRDRCLGVVVDGLASVESGAPVTPDHRFQIGSISKGFTALAVLQQVEEGRIELEAPVTRYLPWFEVRTSFSPITVHHLLSHTAGIVTGTDLAGDAIPEVWALRETETGFAPGERFHYSNTGYKALGLVLEAVTGRPWWETVLERVMAPIGMGSADVVITDEARARLAAGHRSPLSDRPWQSRHGWEASPWFESFTADGTICATAEELTAFARLLLNGGEGVVTGSSFERMTTPVISVPEWPEDHYGYGVRRIVEDGRTLLGHSGGMIGFSAYLLAHPASGRGVVALTNSAFGYPYLVAAFAIACLAAEAAGEPMPEVPDPPDPHRIEGAGELEGIYGDDAGEFRVAAEGDGCRIEVDGIRATLVAGEGDVVLVDHPGLDRFPIRFLRERAQVAGAFWGPRVLRHPGFQRSNAPPPAAWLAIPGRYASWNPWMPGFRVFLREGELWLAFTGDASDNETENRLTALPDGGFRFGEGWSPDRVRFDAEVNGVAQRAVFDAAPFYRTFAE
jgi:CubicO group peptidase (beta-lactamase class C family)